MGRINQLDRSVYNRISAGEVVENPASVVKELVENAIDAGSTEIEVSIEYGGIKSIIVSDNGCGMEEDDLELCVLPHTTSKIATADDLETVSTLGFRGEALASICAVSKTTIRSKYAQSEDGANYIAVEGGEVIEIGKCNLQKGTSIEVASLFFNTPARFRFLKTPKGEENAVTKLMGELILANPDIAISYVVDGETVFATDGDGLDSAVCIVLGSDVYDCMVGVKISERGYTINGFASRAASAGIKANKNNEIFIINGRIVSDTTMQAVVANAYGGRLMRRTYPSVVLDIVMPFDEVDVNVHPNKKEVRFSDTKLIYGLVYNAVKEALEEDEEYQRKTLVNMLSTSESVEKPSETTSNEYVNPFDSDSDNFSPSNEYANLSDGQKDIYVPEAPVIPTSSRKSANTIKIDIPNWFNYDEDGELTTAAPGDLYFYDSEKELEDERRAAIGYRIVGQFFETYIMVEVGDSVLMIDQHAAHERMLFDKFIEEIKNKVIVQELLFPTEVTVTENQARFFRNHLEEFRKMGFEMETGEEKVIVKTVPVVLTKMDVTEFIQSVDADDKIESVTDVSVFHDKVAQTACKSAIKGGDKLNEAQLEAFIEDYIKSNVPIQCPHGRPTLIKFSKRDIEKMFGRIV